MTFSVPEGYIGEPKFAPPETELVRWMSAIPPGEERVWTAEPWDDSDRRRDDLAWYEAMRSKPFPRFVVIAQRGDFPLMEFVERWEVGDWPRVWSQLSPMIKPKSIMEGPTPHLRRGRREKVSHYMNHGACPIVSGLVLKCLLDLDPQSFEVRDCIVDGLSDNTTYHAVLPKREWDVVDPRRTSLKVQCREGPRGRYYLGRAFVSRVDGSEVDGFYLRDDIPGDVHLIANLWGAQTLVSVELMQRIQASGATGIYFSSPEPPGPISHPKRLEI